MLGAIIGDIVGSRFEFNNRKDKDFRFFSGKCFTTDDTILTLAVAYSLIEAEDSEKTLEEITAKNLKKFARAYPKAGYGGMFYRWMMSDNMEPYNSFGNGSAMRISPVGFYARDIEEAKKLSDAVTGVTHSHPEGLKGAEATAVAIVMARQGKNKEAIRKYIEKNYYKVKKYEDYYYEICGHGDEICQVSVPQAFACFFESKDYEDCIRNCIALGGDSDTIAAIAGGIAEAYYGIPGEIMASAVNYLDGFELDIIKKFKDLCEMRNKKETE